ncbi:putative MFS multidrug transporter [Aspergillus affinis]|uniref:putative MFS multidrug transporter n=1 Tax=Aspergillus affinis TaxID=1070780 RepID=UPI0022FE0187|nr:putative MFS multidrug transporter [Aspergillus affinis]KAI9042939.1 putative MFS multidrug transporter [Aspergillus affinis]
MAKKQPVLHARSMSEKSSAASPEPYPGFILTTTSTPGTYTLAFSPSSPKNPYNWPIRRKLFIFVTALLAIMNSGMSSALPSNAMPYIQPEFNVPDGPQTSLPTAVFLIGYIVGPLIFSPLSETVGRRWVMVPSFTVFVLGTLGCALAPNWAALLVFRFICGICGAVPQTVIGGIYADVFGDGKERGRAMVCYMSTASFGPILGPIVSGYASQYSWRWTFWIELIFAGVSWMGLVFMPETFGPAILKREASRLRKAGVIIASSSGGNINFLRVFSRPLTMLISEPIISFTSIFISLAYSLVFFFFQAYPIIFGDMYGLSIQTTSLAFLPVGAGASAVGLLALTYDTYYERSKKAGASWTSSPELHRLPVSCLGGICLTISLFWLAWTAQPSIHYAVPMTAGFLFGFGYQTIFVSLLTYVTDAYTIFSASALASSVIIRSIMGAVFPMAVKPMYAAWGVQWATSFVALLSLVCAPIPFALVVFGPRIRAASRFCHGMTQQHQESESEREGVREGDV